MKIESLDDVKLIMETLLLGYRNIYSPGEDCLIKTKGQIKEFLRELAAYDAKEELVHLEVSKKYKDKYDKEPSVHLWRVSYWKEIQRTQEVIHQEVVASHQISLQRRAKIEILCRKIRKRLNITDIKDNFSRILASDAVINGNRAIIKAYGIEFDFDEELEAPEEYL